MKGAQIPHHTRVHESGCFMSQYILSLTVDDEVPPVGIALVITACCSTLLSTGYAAPPGGLIFIIIIYQIIY